MTDNPGLPQAVADFVLRHLDSVAELEGLLLLRANPVAWTPEALAERLYVDQRASSLVLTALHRRGLVSRGDDGFRYAPESESLRAAVDALAELYPRFLIQITHLIHSKPRQALRDFADAFKLREGN
jgi:hypothetical protein